MFYSQVILARKGPLGKIWLAAHFDKKLTKNQIFTTDISDSVESVMNPSAPLALRVSGHLMLGIVRIYSRKVRYLMTDCTEAMWKIKLACHHGNSDIDLNAVNSMNIDDMRFFGNYSDGNNDYPEFSELAFPEMLLNNYGENSQQLNNNFHNEKSKNYEASSLSLTLNTSNSEHWDGIRDTSNFEDSFNLRKDGVVPLSPINLNIANSSNIRSVEKSISSGTSRVSEVELVRGEASGILNRSSLSIGGQAERFSDIKKFEDDVPAFGMENDHDQMDNLLGDFNAPDIYQPNYGEEVDILAIPAEESVEMPVEERKEQEGGRDNRKRAKRQRAMVMLLNRSIDQSMCA